MCYFLYIASPLTLSEIRSMVPDGITADPADPGEQHVLKSLHRGTQTVARLLIGRCSCDFIHQRQFDRHADERHLRARYRALDLDRQTIISALERHRVAATIPAPEEGWPHALVDFVLEHARNAGPTVYQLAFLPPGSHLGSQPTLRRLHTSQVTQELERWLIENSPVLIVR
jgi:hypothetical protein